MLINKITYSKDYDRSLKLRCVYFGAMVLIGLIGFVCYGLFVPNSSLSEHAQGFYLGAATGIFAGGLICLWRTRRLMHNEAAKKRARIEEQDERRGLILRGALVFAGLFTFFCGAAAVFVVLPFSMEAYYALLGMMLLYTASLAGAYLWLNKHL